MRIWTKGITERLWNSWSIVFKGTLHDMDELPAIAAAARLDTVYVFVKGIDGVTRIGVIPHAEYAAVEYRKHKVLHFNKVTHKYDISKLQYGIGYVSHGSDPWQVLKDNTSAVFQSSILKCDGRKSYVVFGIQRIGAIWWNCRSELMPIYKKLTKPINFRQ